MWRLIAKPLDRLAIRSACGSVLPSPDGQSHSAEAVEFLRRGDFFAPKVAPADLQFTGKQTFEFRSQAPNGCLAGNIVRGACELAGDDWQKRPSMILLHGWNAALQYQWIFPYWSELLTRAGVNAFRFELPHHMSRTPTEADAIRNFLSGDLLHVVRTVHQSLADLRALALWLRAQGSPTVGAWGVSLGAWLTGLAAAHQAEIETAVLLTPVVRMERALKELAFFDPIRASLLGLENQFRSLNLIEHPAPSAGQTLIVASELDLFAPVETIDELEKPWRASVWRVPHGHISVLMASSVIRRIAKWVAEKSLSARFDAASASR